MLQCWSAGGDAETVSSGAVDRALEAGRISDSEAEEKESRRQFGEGRGGVAVLDLDPPRGGKERAGRT